MKIIFYSHTDKYLFKAFFGQKSKKLITARAITIVLALVPMAASAQLYQDGNNTTAISVRDPARQSSTEIDAVINNPAGTAFLPNGWNFSINALYTHGQMKIGNYNKMVENQTGNAIPSFQAAYKDKALTLSMSLGDEGGYGIWFAGENPILSDILNDCNERLLNPYVQSMSQIVSSCSPYDRAISIGSTSGHLYNYTLRLGGSYRINEQFAVYGGLRLNYYDEHGKTGVNRWIRRANGNISSTHDYFTEIDNALTSRTTSTLAIAAALTAAASALGIDVTEITDASIALGEAAKAVSEYNQGAARTPSYSTLIDASTQGWGITPVLGFHLQLNDFDIGAKYEFETKIHTNSSVSSFHIPSVLQLGASWQLLRNIKFAVGGSWSHQSSTSLPGRHQHLDLSSRENYFNLASSAQGGIYYKINNGTFNSWDISASMTFSPIKDLTFSVGYRHGESGYMYRSLYEQSIPAGGNFPMNVFSAGIRYDLTENICLDLGFSKNLCPADVNYYDSSFLVSDRETTSVAAGVNICL